MEKRMNDTLELREIKNRLDSKITYLENVMEEIA